MPRVRRSTREQLISLLTSVRFWGGLSVLVSLVSLALPWWGITVGPSSSSTSWGLFFGAQSQTNVTWDPGQIDALLARNYPFITSLALVTTMSTALGTGLRRGSILTLSIILSSITILAFLASLGMALRYQCNGVNGLPGSCFSSFIGEGLSGSNLVTWGFQAGFYTFIASSILALVAIEIPRIERAIRTR